MTKRTGINRVIQLPVGADQRDAWKRALAASKRQQRARRWQRKCGIATVASPGMVRIQTAAPSGDGNGSPA